MKRRDFIAFVGAAAAGGVWPLAGLAQQTQTKRVGLILPRAEDDPLARTYRDTFWAGIGKHGWSGTNLIATYRWSADSAATAMKPADELVALKPDLLFSVASPPLLAIAKLTQSIPIVFAYATASAVATIPAIQSYARPGGNVTGFVNAADAEIAPKSVGLLRDLIPGLSRFALLYAPNSVPGGEALYVDSFRTLAVSNGLQIRPYPVRTPAEIADAIRMVAADSTIALIGSGDSYLSSNRALAITEAAKYRLVAVWGQQVFATEGGLIAFAPDPVPMIRGAAEYGGLILNGATPAALPIQTNRLSLTVNLRTARALGITIAPSVLVSADELIE